MKITKRQLRQLIEEEVDRAIQEMDVLGVPHRGQERAIRSVWEEYEKNIASLPEDRHPDGAKREERACSRRTEVRLARGKGKDCWWCAKEDKLITSKPELNQCTKEESEKEEEASWF